MEDKKNGSWWSVLGILSLLIAPLICCGRPLIAGILGATGVGLFIPVFCFPLFRAIYLKCREWV
ncbi:hypothetical protein [Alicyclobacillus tolerans]|uniref:Uncharacterized protein n=1 Tax=Alicyclobacillus tolerans TaxID=90970 RepID=A0ABT9LUQ3_9BACL|nr:hypothetical protein [Alicyclobacillus tengchongensis]MDP9728006.1 hypothetical protein [Alicyclobacillus tengchongensis]